MDNQMNISPEWQTTPVPDAPRWPLVFLKLESAPDLLMWRRMYADETLAGIAYEQEQPEGMPRFSLERFDGPDSMLANIPDGRLFYSAEPVQLTLTTGADGGAVLTMTTAPAAAAGDQDAPSDHGDPRTYEQRTQDVRDDLARYGYVNDDDLLDALDACAQINDDNWHSRAPSVILEAVADAEAALARIRERLWANQDTPL